VLRSERKRAIELAARSDVWFMGRCTQKVRTKQRSQQYTIHAVTRACSSAERADVQAHDLRARHPCGSTRAPNDCTRSS
jgi:hypothetical protein